MHAGWRSYNSLLGCGLRVWLTMNAAVAAFVPQPQLVVAYDPPTNVTQYIQARGRARAPDSTYAWMRPASSAERSKVEGKRGSLLE